MEQPLKDRIAVFLQRRPGTWIASGDLQRIVAAKTDYTPANVSRRLRELKNEGLLNVEYRGKRHAYYRWHQEPIQEPLFKTYEKDSKTKRQNHLHRRTNKR